MAGMAAQSEVATPASTHLVPPAIHVRKLLMEPMDPRGQRLGGFLELIVQPPTRLTQFPTPKRR